MKSDRHNTFKADEEIFEANILPEQEVDENNELIEDDSSFEPTRRRRPIKKIVASIAAIALTATGAVAGYKIDRRDQKSHQLIATYNSLNRENIQFLGISSNGNGLVVKLTQNKEDPAACTVSLPVSENGKINSDIIIGGTNIVNKGDFNSLAGEQATFSNLRKLPGYLCHAQPIEKQP